ncbi:hypothetical protein AB0933_32720 [Streptomyces venezuelae]|uniref:hypothetical protein n=1 Tax=Streptomyces venezuelae TaxID=54571 RepID=UPI003454390E
MTEKTTEQISNPTLPAAFTNLAELWERMADHDESSVGLFTGPTAATLDIEVAERGSTYRKAAADVREVLRTGCVPSDLLGGNGIAASSAPSDRSDRCRADHTNDGESCEDFERRDRYAAALYATLEVTPNRHPWSTRSSFQRAVWYARADAAIALADAEQASLRTRISELEQRPTPSSVHAGVPLGLREAARLVGEYTGNRDDANALMLLRIADGTPRPTDPVVAAAPSVPAGRDLRDRIIQALDECRSLIPTAQADAVMAVLAARADRAVVLRDAADKLHERGKPVCVEEDGDCCWFDAERELRRMADEAQQAGEGRA